MDTSMESIGEQPKRWSLRKRKSPQRLIVSMDESQASSTGDSPSIMARPLPSERKRKAVGGQKGPSPKRKARKATQQPAETSGQQLFDIIMAGKSALQAVASEWVDRYQQDAEQAMVELVQFYVLCCGCQATITMEMFQTEDPSDVIRSLTENFAEESGEYPLIMTGPQYKKFKANFVEFSERVVQQCQHSILYDEYMLDTLIAWLVGFTDSQVRAFRHTCTLACMKLVTALVSVANSVKTELDNTTRQIDAERKRQQSKKAASGKLEKLLTKKAELQRNVTELEETMRGIFSSVFVHRYRDIRPEIRALCITELGVWMVHYSAKFLADSYLKYIGWTLYDKVGEVRLACVQVMESLYGSQETQAHLELFTQKFKDRLVSLRLDKEDSVAVHGIRLCGCLLQLDILEAEDCLEVCELVFLENKAISHAAGEFAVGYLFSEDFMAQAKQGRVSKGRKKPSDSQIMLRELVRFFLEVKIHDHATYFVDSLWEHSDVLKDWDAMVSLLLDEKCGIVFTDEEEGVLIEIMACAVRRATGAKPPAGRGRGRVLSNKEKRAMEEARESLSTTLMVSMPDLISKFGSEAGRAANLANIPQHFDLELYTEHRLQKHLQSLLTHLHQLTLKHLDPAVLDECAQTFRYLHDTEFTLFSTAEVAFKQLVDELVQNLKQYLTDCRDLSLMEESEECFGLQVALRRLASFYKLLDLSGWQFTGDLGEVLEREECGEEIVALVVSCLKLEVLWALQALDENNPNRDAMREVKIKLVRLVRQCQELVKFGEGAGQREAFVSLCDLLMAFAKQLRRVGQLGPLVYTPDPALQEAMQEFILNQVMVNDEDEEEEPETEEEALSMAERLNDRRVLLAGFLKLAMFGAIDMQIVAPIFGQYLTQYHNFGDLIKTALSRCREASPMAWYRTVLLSLQQLFTAHLEENGGSVDQTAADWADLKDLARKYALSFGFDRYDANKVRQPLMGIHRDGIVFALSKSHGKEDEEDPLAPPPHLDFLLVLSELSFRLLDVDRHGNKGVIPYLRSQVPGEVWEEGGEEWESFRVYRNSLSGKDQDAANTSRAGKGKGKQTAAAAGKGKRKAQKAPPQSDGDGWLSARPAKTPAMEGSEVNMSDTSN